mmetsp:Transcript_22005/g.61213  ORF Transcript_22005/g.61213 Transcript_22005/m.61213 type:complete len:140 (+) Transcript_22005:515-934(+)
MDRRDEMRKCSFIHSSILSIPTLRPTLKATNRRMALASKTKTNDRVHGLVRPENPIQSQQRKATETKMMTIIKRKVYETKNREGRWKSRSKSSLDAQSNVRTHVRTQGRASQKRDPKQHENTLIRKKNSHITDNTVTYV